ncbi:hypothetical protein HanPI659440_Chr04g0172881 [Helianthus annuus]|nr:hypothetical protein HanPI659440_Chr04g0172881 [Helianthus annuus]
MVPENWFCPRSNNNKLVKFPISCGIGPNKELFWICSLWRLLRDPMLEGICPMRKFELNVKVSKLTNLDMDAGISPVSLFS